MGGGGQPRLFVPTQEMRRQVNPSDPLREIRIPTIDISSESHRQSVVAQGAERDWQGHPHTVLLPNGRTVFCAWQASEGAVAKDGGQGAQTQLHGTGSPFLKRSDDGGRTWSERIQVPATWLEPGRGAPTIHRLVDADGAARLFVFCRDAQRMFLQAVSEDEGETWSDMRPLPRSKGEADPIRGWTAPISILETIGAGGAKKHLMWYERSRDGRPAPGEIWQSASADGGLSWGQSKPVVDKEGASEPAAVRSPDGKRLLLLIRENNRKLNSLFSVSEDEGDTWSKPRQLPLALTGDRHLGRYAADGRLVVALRPRCPSTLPNAAEWNARRSHFTVWVGRFEDIVQGREGQFLVKLVHSHAGVDHTYPGLERLPDGDFLATTYIKLRPGPELHSVVSVRFAIEELDARLGT